jgi:hypothetical protein
MPLLQTNAADQPAVAPTPPQPPGRVTGADIGTGQIVFDAPKTAADLAALRERRDLLSSQLSNVANRRASVARELQKSPEGVARRGLEERIQVLDQRIAQIEKDIEVNSRLIANAPLSLGAQTASQENPTLPPGQLSSGQITAISIVGTLTVGMPLAIAIGRTLFRRAGAPKPAPQILESAQRLERMEQAIDAMAEQVERISEGQRFVTQLMAPRQGQVAVPAAPAAVPVPASDRVVG